jgi:hypothetical protein
VLLRIYDQDGLGQGMEEEFQSFISLAKRLLGFLCLGHIPEDHHSAQEVP